MPHRDWFSEPSFIIFLGGPACSGFLLLFPALYLLPQAETFILLIIFPSKSRSVSEPRRRWGFVFRTRWGGCFGAQHGSLHEQAKPSRGAVVFSYLLSFETSKCRHQCCTTCKKSFPSPNVAHDTPYRHPPIHHRWQVAKLNWHQNFPKYIISPQARRDEPTLLFTCSFCAFWSTDWKRYAFQLQVNQMEQMRASCLVCEKWGGRANTRAF